MCIRDSNYTVTFNIDQETHIATASKDNTHLFEGKYEKLTEKDGKRLIDWANTGEGEMPKEPVKAPTPVAVSYTHLDVYKRQMLYIIYQMEDVK